MKGDIDRFLDDEVGPEALDEHARTEAQAWDRLLEAFRTEQPGAPPPPWLEERIMAEIHALPSRGALRRLVDWLLSPRPVRVSPLTIGVATAGLAAAIALPLIDSGGDPAVEGPEPSGPAQAATVYVEFSLEAPGAESVAVAGDFSGWDPEFHLSDPDGDGVWTGRVPVRPGVHSYMFVVDGSEWMTDPRAERYQDDGFGNRNAVLAVTHSSL